MNWGTSFKISQLYKGHAQKLIKTNKRANAIFSVVSINATTKFLDGDKTHDLRKYGLTVRHWLHPLDVNFNHRKTCQSG